MRGEVYLRKKLIFISLIVVALFVPSVAMAANLSPFTSGHLGTPSSAFLDSGQPVNSINDGNYSNTPAVIYGNSTGTAQFVEWSLPAATNVAKFYSNYVKHGLVSDNNIYVEFYDASRNLLRTQSGIPSGTVYTGLFANNVKYVRFLNTYGAKSVDDYIELQEFDIDGLPVMDTTAPISPTGIQATDSGLKATVWWAANAESDLDGYNLYMNNTKINTSIIRSTNFVTGTLTHGNTYTFKVAAVDTSGNESPKSNSVSVIIADVMAVNFLPNMDSIVLLFAGGTMPYTVTWSGGTDTFSATKYTITGLTAATDYTITVTDSALHTLTQTVNTGTVRSYNPPPILDPTSLFQSMMDNFGDAGLVAIKIITAAVALALIVILAAWGWKLAKKWLSVSK